MKKILFLLFSFIILFAQSTANYTFTSSNNGSLVDMTDAEVILLPTNATGDFASQLHEISFQFVFMGIPYQHFSVNSNGLLRLGTSLISNTGINDLATTSNLPLITPFWDDLNQTENQALNPKSRVLKKVIGNAPNRILVVEWRDFVISKNALTDSQTSTFQLLLYETGKIEFIYGKMQIAAGSNIVTASIGFSFSKANTKLLSVKSLSPYTIGTTTTVTNNLINISDAGDIAELSSDSDGQRVVLSFTPSNAIPNPPTQLVFTNILATSLRLNWNDATNEKGYIIYRSIDGVNYTLITGSPLTANTTTYQATGLQTNTKYYFKVYSITESKLSTPLIDSCITLAPYVNGLIKIGEQGDYIKIQDALNDMALKGVNGTTILEINDDYNKALETFPINLPYIVGVNEDNRVIIRPSINNKNFVLQPPTANYTIKFNGAKYFTIDGRPGGVDTINLMQISTIGNYPAIQYLNNAQYNNLVYLIIKGNNANTSGTMGVINFSTTTSGTGNNYNKISNCEVTSNTSYPNVLIYSYGSSTISNQYNIIENCKFYNWRLTTTQSAILLSSYNSSWYIRNNHFYQTDPYSGVNSATITAITITSGTNYIIENNYIGGSQPYANGLWKITDTSTTSRFVGINLGFTANVGNNLIANNKIKNFNFLTSLKITTGGGTWCGIQITSGKFNVNNNVIGSSDSAGNIKLISTQPTWMVGMNLSGSNTGVTDTVYNNIISGLANIGIDSISSGTLKGIQIAGTANKYIANNTIGSISTPNSLFAGEENKTFLATHIIGLDVSSSATNVIKCNNIYNLSNFGVSVSSGLTYAIRVTNGLLNDITQNNISDIISYNKYPTGGGSTPTAGICATAGTNNFISKNIISNIENKIPASIWIAGILSGTNSTIYSNKIFNLRGDNNSNIVGIYKTANNSLIYNNMITLGVNLSKNTSLKGIYDAAGSNKYFYNSIYLGGIVDSASYSTYAFQSDVANVNRVFKNNIFGNLRSHFKGSAKHYVIRYGGSSTNPTGLISDYNIFINKSEPIGYYNGNVRNTINDWRIAVGSNNDQNSRIYFPQFIDTLNGDLHLIVDAIDPNLQGFPILEVVDDFDGNSRDPNSPYIGAHENISFPLPVELSFFDGKIDNNKILLSWETKSEINTKEFEVQKLLNEQWITIGKVAANGNTNKTNFYNFIDNSLIMKNQEYRVKIIDNDGKYNYSYQINVNGVLPLKFSLEQNYPNPFNPMTKIRFTIPVEYSNNVTSLKVYDVLGKEIETLVNEVKEAGNYEVTFDARKLGSGIFIYQLQNGNMKISRKMILNK